MFRLSMQQKSIPDNAITENQEPHLPLLDKSTCNTDHNDEKYQQKLEYWKKKLAELTILPLQTDFDERDSFNFQGDRCSLELNTTIIKNCKQIAEANHVSIKNVILTALFALLYRYTNESDLCIGVLTDNRSNYLSTNANQIGCFTTILPIRLQTTEDMTFRELLLNVSSTLTKGIKNQIPLNEINDYLLSSDIQPAIETASIFKISCSFNDEKRRTTLQDTISSIPEEINSKRTQFENFGINFELKPDGTCTGYIEFNTELFKKESMQAFMKRLVLILSEVRTNVSKEIKDIAILLEDEKQKIFEFEHSNEPDTPFDDFFHLQFERSVQQGPENIAVMFHNLDDKEQHLTYRELDNLTRSLAAYLQSCGIGPEKPVGVCIARSLDLIISMIAVFRAGGVIVPLESLSTLNDDPKQRIEYKVKDTNLDIVLVDDKTKDFFIEKKSLFCLNVNQKEYLSKENKYKYQKPEISPKNRAYVIYTSGTTGEPKGVEIEYKGLTNLFYAIKDRNLPDFGKVLCSAPAIFDAFFWELLEWLSTGGGQLHFINEQERLSPQKQTKVIGKYKIHCATLLPLLFSNLDPDRLPNLSDVITMGAIPHKDVLEKWHKAGRIIRNEYGPTENTICSTENPYDPRGPFTSIGRPIRNVTLYVLDDNLKQCPVGVPGNLYIGGLGLARGYLGKAKLTAQAFPFLIYDAEKEGYSYYEFNNNHKEKMQAQPLRLYNTGDRACLFVGPDNKLRINFVGRRDRQVKLNGVRIEIDGIETILRKCPCIGDVYLTLMPSKDALTAYIIPKQEKSLAQLDIKSNVDAYLKNHTSIHQVAWPKTIVLMKEFPLTKNGKINTKALPSPQEMTANDLPATALQQQLCDIWAGILKLEVKQIDVTKSFRDLGGTSLTLATLESMLHQKLNISSQFGITMLNDDLTVQSLENLLKPYLEATRRRLPSPPRLLPFSFFDPHEKSRSQSLNANKSPVSLPNKIQRK